MSQDDDWMQQGECISALVDGELPDAAWPQTLDALQHQAQARAAWADYHLLREALQDGQVPVSTDDAVFMARLRQALAQPAAPVDASPPLIAPMAVPLKPLPQHSANDAHWKRWATLASLCAVAVLAWQAVPPTPGASPAALAQAPAAPTPAATGVLVLTPLEHEPIFAATQPVMVRDARLDAVLASQRAATPSPSAFVRNATFEVPQR